MHTLRPKIPAWYREYLLDDSLRGQILPQTPYRELVRIRRRFWLAITVYVVVMLIAFKPVVLALGNLIDEYKAPGPMPFQYILSAIVLFAFFLPILLVAMLFNLRRRLRTLQGRCLNCGELRHSDFLEVCSNCGDSLAEQDGYRRISDEPLAVSPPNCRMNGLTHKTSASKRTHYLAVALTFVSFIFSGLLIVAALGRQSVQFDFYQQPIRLLLLVLDSIALSASMFLQLYARQADVRANLDRLAGRCFKCEASLEPHGDECPQCGSWLPIQRLYEEYFRTRCFQGQRGSTGVPEQAQ